MLARSLTAAIFATTVVTAWPIAFYPTNDCHSDPVVVLYEPPSAGSCGFFHEPVKSYSGGTDDQVQKILLYYDDELCPNDAAHRVYSNHTINNNANECIPFKQKHEIPRAFTFIEEILPPNPPKKNSTAAAACNVLVVQS